MARPSRLGSAVGGGLDGRHGGDPGLGGKARCTRDALAPAGDGVQRRAQESDHARARLQAGGLLDPLDCLGGARVLGGEAAGLLQRAGHGTTEDAGERDEQAYGEQGALGAGGDAIGEGGEQRRLLCEGYRHDSEQQYMYICQVTR